MSLESLKFDLEKHLDEISNIEHTEETAKAEKHIREAIKHLRTETSETRKS